MPERLRQTAFRLPPELLARVRSHAERMSQNDEGIQYTMTDALKTLLVESLKRHEAEAPEPKKRR